MGSVGFNLPATRKERSPANDPDVSAPLGGGTYPFDKRAHNGGAEEASCPNLKQPMKMKITLYILFSLLILSTMTTLFLSCSPLRQVQRAERKQEQVVDKSIEELVSVEIDRQVASFRQTRVEFYPSNIVYVDTLTKLESEFPLQNGERTKDSVQRQTLSTVRILPVQGVKSITTTDILTKADKISQRDSSTQTDIVHTTHTNYTEKIAEKPPATTQAIKWIALSLIAVLLILIILRIRF